MLNNKLVEEFLNEYILIAKKNGIQLLPKIQEINFIFIEPLSVKPAQLTGHNLGKVDVSKKVILLSNNCLLDTGILKATLFREVTHYMGVPYDLDGIGIMSLNKHEGYSYSWINCDDALEIQEFEFHWLFSELKKYVN